jgi:hypothetical protein
LLQYDITRDEHGTRRAVNAARLETLEGALTMETVARKGWSRCRKHPLTCARCNGVISVGDVYQWSNLDRKARHVKATDDTCDLAWRPSETETERSVVFDEAHAVDAPPRAAVAGSIDALIDARIEARLMGFEPDSALDVDAVRALISEALANSATTVRIEHKPYEPVMVNGAHPAFARLAYFASKSVNGARQNVLLHGPAGGGKTTACRMLAEALSIPRWGYISLSPQAPASRIEGFIDATGTFRDTEFFRCYSDGGVFLFDEVGNMSPALGVALNTALENGHANFPSGMVARHPDFVCLAADNTPLWGGTRTYSVRQAVDGAFRDRWVFLYWPIDAKLERRVALGINPESAPWIEWVQKVREWALTNAPQLPVTPRATYRGAEFLLDGASVGLTLADIAESVIFRGLDAETVSRAIRAVPYPDLAVRG